MVPNLRFTGLCDRGALRRVRLCLTTPLRAHFDRYCVMNRRRLCTVSDLCEVTWTALTCLAIVYRMLRSRIPKAVHGTLCCPVLVWWSLTSTFQKREAWKRCSANCCTNVTQVEISPLWQVVEPNFKNEMLTAEFMARFSFESFVWIVWHLRIDSKCRLKSRF